jgi:hypothetical protein
LLESSIKKMNESRLDEDLKALAKRPQADLPTDFNATVWSKIQRRETPAHAQRQNWLKVLLSPLATPQWAAAALTFALLAGWALGRITTSSVPNTAETRLAASVTGEVIDMACYFDDGASGPDHAVCARMYCERASCRTEGEGRKNLRSHRQAGAAEFSTGRQA